MADGSGSALQRASPIPAPADAPRSARKRPSRLRNTRPPYQQTPGYPRRRATVSRRRRPRAYNRRSRPTIIRSRARRPVRAPAGSGACADQSSGAEQPRKRAQRADARFRQLSAHAAARLRAAAASGAAATAAPAAGASAAAERRACRRSHPRGRRLSPGSAAAPVRPACAAGRPATTSGRAPAQPSHDPYGHDLGAYLPGEAPFPANSNHPNADPLQQGDWAINAAGYGDPALEQQLRARLRPAACRRARADLQPGRGRRLRGRGAASRQLDHAHRRCRRRRHRPRLWLGTGLQGRARRTGTGRRHARRRQRRHARQGKAARSGRQAVLAHRQQGSRPPRRSRMRAPEDRRWRPFGVRRRATARAR